jgi:hypothetical protein
MIPPAFIASKCKKLELKTQPQRRVYAEELLDKYEQNGVYINKGEKGDWGNDSATAFLFWHFQNEYAVEFPEFDGEFDESEAGIRKRKKKVKETKNGKSKN